jgi:iron complex outermembrane recepter protein
MRAFKIAAAAALGLLAAVGAEAAALRGVVKEEGGFAAGAKVSVPSVGRAAVTDEEGKFEILGLPAGVYAVSVVSPHGRASRTVDLAEGDAEIEVEIKDDVVELPAITVTASSLAREVLEAPQSVAVVEGRKLERDRAQTVAGTVAETPGVNAQTSGAGIAKPVIRGLTSQRSAVVVDGVKDETHQWGDEHGPLVDVLDAERIEVLRGPQSLLYGSDALGGVLHVVKKPLPSVEAGDPRLGGVLAVNAFSNNGQGAANLALAGAAGAAGYRGNVTFRRSGDTRTPKDVRGLVLPEQGGTLKNSGAEEINGAGIVGVSGDWGSVAADFSRFNEELEIHQDPVEEPGATPRQKLGRDALGLRAAFNAPFARLEAGVHRQESRRREFESAEASAPALALSLRTVTGSLLARHAPIDLGGHAHLSGTVGVELQGQENRVGGEEFLIPAYEQANAAVFLNEEVRVGRVSLSAGARSDRRALESRGEAALSLPAERRTYGAVSGAGGVVLRLTDVMSVAAHAGRGWRAPSAFELYAAGEHEGTGRFERGNPDLGVETSFNADASFRWASGRLQAEVTAFRNRIQDYIYSYDTGTHDFGDDGIDDGGGNDDLPVFQNAQADATLRGAEISLQVRAADGLTLEGGFDSVRGTNDRTGSPLPRMPARRLMVGVRVSGESLGVLSHPYGGLKARRVSAQRRVDVNEAPSRGYTLWGLSLGAEVSFGSRVLSVDAGVDNLLDRAYADHLSLLREAALNPGRDAWVKLSMPFTLAR